MLFAIDGRKVIKIKHCLSISLKTAMFLISLSLISGLLLASCSQQLEQPQSESQGTVSEELNNQATASTEDSMDTPIVSVSEELQGLEQHYSSTWFDMGYEIDPYYDAEKRIVYWRIGLYNNYGSANPTVLYIDEVDYALVFRDEYGTPVGEIYQQYRGSLGGSYVPGQGVSDSEQFSIDEYLNGRIPTYCDVYFFRVSKVRPDGSVEIWGTDITQLSNKAAEIALYKYGRSPKRFNEINGIESVFFSTPERLGVTYYPPTQLYETP